MCGCPRELLFFLYMHTYICIYIYNKFLHVGFFRLQMKRQRKEQSLCELKSFMYYQLYLWSNAMSKCRMHREEKLKVQR